MSKSIRNFWGKIIRKERGQVLVLVAVAAVGIIAIVGLVTDVGLMFVGNARLRRATDAAALAAALQYREGVPTTQLKDAATEFLLLNGVTLNAAHPVTVDTCVTVPSLCKDPATGAYTPRKLVRVRVTATVGLAFLPVIGINSVPISAEATSETASLDLVLVIDTSESMTYDALKPSSPNYDPHIPWELRDPSVCNDDQKSKNAIIADDAIPQNVKDDIVANINTDGIPGECHPFEEVKKAAMDFVDRLYYPYDRVAVVTFDKQAYNVLQLNQNCTNPAGCTTDDIEQIKKTIKDKIKNLEVYEGEGVCDEGQPCRPYCTQAIINAGNCDTQPANLANLLQPDAPGAIYKGTFGCGDGWFYDDSNLPDSLRDPSGCSSTNIGDGMMVAGDEYGQDPQTGVQIGRQGALWVVVLLTDGSANAGTRADGSAICPDSTWDQYRSPNAPICRDVSLQTRHCLPDDPNLASCKKNGTLPTTDPDYLAGFIDQINYDADDYAHDMADYVGIDQNALVFTIGLGNQVKLPFPAGEKFLQYAAQQVGNGLYYYGKTGTDLGPIFKKIGDNIAIRLAR